MSSGVSTVDLTATASHSAQVGIGRTDVVRVGVIGYGYWGPNIVRNFGALERCEVVSVCDKNPQALQRVKKGVSGG